MNRHLLVVGAQGRMGQEIIALAQEDREWKSIGGVDKVGDWHRDFKNVKSKDGMVVVDFSLPESFAAVTDWCEKFEVPLVSGTTGLTAKDFKRLQRLAKKVPTMWSSNMGQGVNFVNQLLKQWKDLPEGFDLQIEEIHHRRKKDKPSGTAITMQKNVEAAVGKKLPPPLSVRGGGVFGVHRLICMAEEEMIILEHSALSRRVFARGALVAAKKLQGLPPGLYQSTEVLAAQNPSAK